MGVKITPENKCGFCTNSKCCTYITEELTTPRSMHDFDHMLWQLSHKGVQAYKDEEGWYLLVNTPCLHLQADGHCGIYADRPPDDDTPVEVQALEGGDNPEVGIDVTYEFRGRTVELIASNPSYVPIELTLEFRTLRGVEFPDPDDDLRWVVPPRSDTLLMALDLLENATRPVLEFQYRYLAGDPNARHRPDQPYRAPFAVSTNHPITQAFPQVATHTTRDSQYAVDIAMPIGTDVMAARGGVVFDVAARNFSGGLDPARDGPKANVVRILHDDGTYAIYAHLNWNSIRVRVGDVVERGEYIADSGNTGRSRM